MSSIQFDDTPLMESKATALSPISPLRMLLAESVNALGNLRDTASIREKVLSLIFSITPADSAAVIMHDAMLGANRVQENGVVRVRRGIIEKAKKDGEGILWNDPPASVICVPMEAFDNPMGVIYAESSNPNEPLTNVHLNLLSGVAATAALAFQLVAHIEQLQAENATLEKNLKSRHALVGNTAVMAELSKFIAKAAPAASTVLIQGESGTGKELVARAIHQNSTRSKGPFVAINCAALPESLLESELFGHEKGAFTGAAEPKKGEFEAAAGGTLFLDEIGELSPSIQAKLLRALQEREIKRLGGTKTIPVDIRLLAATNRDLEAAAAKNEFRQDLYYRLNVLSVKTPPLRERKDDIRVLARHFVEQARKETGRPVRGISREAENMLLQHDWPGNVRELQNVIERAVVLGSSDMIVPEDLPENFFERQTEGAALPNYQEALNKAKRDLLEKAVARAGGDLKQAAALLGVSSSYVYRLVGNFGLTHLLK